jgi:hypothetical protein
MSTKTALPAFCLMQKYGVTSEEYERKMLDLAIHKMGSARNSIPIFVSNVDAVSMSALKSA